jgi:predicted oxidoreductase
MEAGRGGAEVVVIDMFSVFGGIGVMSHGGVCLISSPVQHSFGIKDNPDLDHAHQAGVGKTPISIP